MKKWGACVTLQCHGLELKESSEGTESPSAQAYDGKNRAIFILQATAFFCQISQDSYNESIHPKMINANLVIVHMDHFSVIHFTHKMCLSLHVRIAHVLCHSPVAGGLEQITSLCEATGRRNYHICGWHPLLTLTCNYLSQNDYRHRVRFILGIRRIAYEV